MDANSTDYGEKIRSEGAFWDREFVTAPDEPRYRSFFHHNAWCRDRLRDPVLRRIIGLAGPECRAFEIGCGVGWLSLQLAQSGARVVAGDVAEACLDAGREKAAELGLADRCEFIHFDANHDRPPGGPYDLIVAFGSLHHVQELGACLDCARESLAPGGHFALVECIDPAGPRARLAALLADGAHLLLPTDRSYRRKLGLAWSKLRGRGEQEFEWSPFEMAGGSDWEDELARRFVEVHRHEFMGFLSPFIARVQLPECLLRPLTALLYGFDQWLIKARILIPEYRFVVCALPPSDSANANAAPGDETREPRC